MNDDTRIKIIKRAERDGTRLAGAEESQAAALSAVAENERNAVTTVARWVSELRQKKDEEATRIRKFLSQKAA
ncbi:MAG: hypothetical protein H0T45_18120 [Pyrinomonadaceae bacterium]|nr:hypothetical protein [Pyrinomonadaceae bacterium]